MTRRAPIRLLGTPHTLDLVVRPVARAAQLVVGLGASVAVALLVGPYWAPLPLAASFLLYELVFWWRGDRPVVLRLDDALELTDPRRGATTHLAPAEVTAATVHHRDAGGGRREVVVVLADDHEILLAARFLVEPEVPLPGDAVDVEVMDQLLGGYGGLLAAVAPPEARCRQTFDDPAGQALAWLHAHVAPRAWRRRAVRVWRGEAPPLDTYGLHVGPPSGLLVLEGDDWTLRDEAGTTRGTVTLVTSARSLRTVELARAPRAGERVDLGTVVVETIELPLLILRLDEGLELATPAPVAGLAGREQPPHAALLHCHVPEGGALLWTLLRRWPQSAWPAPLRKQAAAVLGPSGPPPRAGQRTPTG